MLCSSQGEFVFSDKLLLFSSDGNSKVMINKDLAYGFSTSHKVYKEGLINGEKKKWLVSDAPIDLASVEMVSVPSQYFRNVETFFYFASIPKYAFHRKMDLEQFAEILWASLYFHLDDEETVLPKYRNISRPTTKLNVFKENLYFLIKNTPLLRNEIRSILNEIKMTPVMKEKNIPSLQVITRDRVFWFLQEERNEDLRMFLDVCVSSSVKDKTFIYAELVEDLDIADSVRLVAVQNPQHRMKYEKIRQLMPLSEFILRHKLEKIRNMEIVLEGECILPSEVFEALSILFLSVDTLTLDHPQGHKYIEEYSALLVDILEADESRKKKNMPPVITGLILSHTLFLTQRSILQLESSRLIKFGFKEYYPLTYPSEHAYRRVEPYVKIFMDRLFQGEIELSKTLMHFAAPDAFYFERAMKHNYLPHLDTIEIFVNNDIRDNLTRDYRFSLTETQNITRVILVESAYANRKRILHVLDKLSVLPNVSSLDITKTSLDTSAMLRVLMSSEVSYRHQLNKISFTYIPEIGARQIKMPMHTLSHALPNITKYKISIPMMHEEAVLPALIADVRNTLITKSGKTKHLDLSLVIRRISVIKTGYSTIFKVYPYVLDRYVFARVYNSLGLQKSRLISMQQLMQIFGSSAKYHKSYNNAIEAKYSRIASMHRVNYLLSD
ncbi:hypothetical protein NEMIN01_2264 [Nematocida minor]|uniref:uncharacterized protein n=1 Tax=Nematocida minor TaxID=1912983 RepID=UPI00221E8499|nr:uncharacterized protein NEMIN01_2264 [Nematocida minor]KAI5192884.1 hypothetical protein NEMIN01_2264 [Nematocida minor]